MPGDDPQYEYKSESVLRISEADTIAKFQAEGWELVSQQQQLLLWTELRFRRRLPKKPRWTWALWALMVAGAVAAIILGAIHERSVARNPEIAASPAATSDLGEGEPTGTAETSSATPTPPSLGTPTGSPAPSITPSRSPTPSGSPAAPTRPAAPTPAPTPAKWVEVARFEGVSKAYRTTKPFKVDGPVRARYRFYFEPDDTYIYGEFDVYPADEDGTCGGPPLGGRRLFEQRGSEEFDAMQGRMCANFWPPGVQWDRGNLTIIIETRR